MGSAEMIPACMSTDGCQPLMAISRDKKTKTKRASDRAAVIDPLELLTAHDILLHATKSCSA